MSIWADKGHHQKNHTTNSAYLAELLPCLVSPSSSPLLCPPAHLEIRLISRAVMWHLGAATLGHGEFAIPLSMHEIHRSSLDSGHGTNPFELICKEDTAHTCLV